MGWVATQILTTELYAELSPEVWLKVKAEKTDRSEFRANLKAKNMRRVESTAFDSDEGNDGEEGRA